MTDGQIAYANYLEQQRYNTGTLAETATHNRNVEFETARSNKANEKLTRQRQKEQKRSNKATEKIETAKLVESATHNRNVEAETSRANRASEYLKKYASDVASEASKYSAQLAAAARVQAAQIAAASAQAVQYMRDLQSQADRENYNFNAQEQRDLERAIKAAERYQKAVLAEDENAIKREANEINKIVNDAKAHESKTQGDKNMIDAFTKVFNLLQDIVNKAFE